MTKRNRSVSPASVRARLLNLAHARREEFEYVLTRYANERLLYRLSRSEYHDSFVLKGAMLFELWSGIPHRATRDVDLLGIGDSTIAHLVDVFGAICSTEVDPDGIVFMADSIEASTIREDDKYEGVRLLIPAELAGARTRVQVDIGFGDAIVDQASRETYPVMLDQPAPVLRVYPRESVVAEKLEAMVSLGIANSRMKDFYDLRVLPQTFPFDGSTLRDAIRATFTRRGTAIPAEPFTALTRTFFDDVAKSRQWRAFASKFRPPEKATLRDVVDSISRFVMPPLKAAAADAPFRRVWSPADGWAMPSSRPARNGGREVETQASTKYNYEVELQSGIGDEHSGVIWALNRRAADGWRLATAYKDSADRHVLIFEKIAQQV